MNEANYDAPALVRRRRRIARQQREKTPEPIAKTGGVKHKFSDEESSSTTTTPNEYERLRNSRLKSKATSTSSGGSNSNMAYREKILNRRDRAHGVVKVARSHSQPRQLEPEEMKAVEEKASHDDSGNVIKFFQKAKRSLSIPSRRRDVACETSPIRATEKKNEEIIKRYARAPMTKPIPVDAEKQKEKESRLEMNLKRFEDERRRFEMEKEKFEREKKQAEHVRFQRLIEFERRRSIQRREREQLALEAAKIALAEIEKQRMVIEESRRTRRSKSKSHDRSRSHSKHREKFEDDYESSTAMSSSSRDNDFEGADEFAAQCKANEMHEPNEENNEEGFWSKFLFEQPVLPPKPIEKPVYKATVARQYLIIDDGGPISMKRVLFVESPIIWKQLFEEYPSEWAKLKRTRNRCIANFILLSILFGVGGFLFRFIEGTFENFYKCGVRRVKRDFVEQLWVSSHDLSEEDWKSMARSKLRGFEEELHIAHEAGLTSYSGLKAWTFINGVAYCMTIVTTIGYGHISPATNTGRAVTIIYAIIGIPIFLILLADFGKLFTRGIKFLWAYVRRLYYTGSLRRVRKQAQVQEMLRGMNYAYEIATFRRPSMMMKESDLERAQTATPNSSHLAPTVTTESPTTPIPPEIEIDDEFNLPVSLAFFILIAYILCGAAVYSIWEEWSFFESCYFVFVSMSTIGFGDYVPKHPMRMMASIIYLIFGLSLTSMCINVIQVKLSDSFRQASAKIGATIGLTLAEEEARSSQNLTPVPENASVHSYTLKPDAQTSPNFNPNNVDNGTYDNAEIRDGKIILQPGANNQSTLAPPLPKKGLAPPPPTNNNTRK